jgi:HlyD family secretion protein
MRRILIILGVILLGAGGWWGYTAYRASQTAQQAAQDAATEQAAQTELENVIWASGKLEPAVWATLSPAASGTVSQIHVIEGDWVEADQLLVELENSGQQSQVVMAEAAVAEAQAALDNLLADPTSAELAAAQAELATAQANVALAAGQMIETQAAIHAAQAVVNTTQQQYRELASHPTQAEQTAALARVAVAEAGMEQAQATYNRVRWDPEIGARPESLVLRQMTAAWEAAKAEAAFTTQGPTQEELAAAASLINGAKAQVEAAESRAPGAEAAVKAALARQQSAQAALDKLLAGATPSEIAMAQAKVESAQAGLQQAQAQLRQSQLFAPFAGQVGVVHVRVGELITPGQALLMLGDTRQMQVRTTDLRETDVVRLTVAMPVEVTFDALPERIFQGEVSRIAPVSIAEKGSTNYTVQVTVSELDASLRWGMTAFVNIRYIVK